MARWVRAVRRAGATGCRDAPSELHEERLETVLRTLRASRARSVLDVGCGDGELLVRLAREPRFRRVVGVDLSLEALQAAEARLGPLLAPEKDRVSLLHASFTEPAPALVGFDAAALVETIEHIDPGRLSSVERAVFGSFRPGTVIVTTPNREYNLLYGMPERALRHPDHRFEWTRARFHGWASGVARRNGYAVQIGGIGDADHWRGSPTQMATFRRAGAPQAEAPVEA